MKAKTPPTFSYVSLHDSSQPAFTNAPPVIDFISGRHAAGMRPGRTATRGISL